MRRLARDGRRDRARLQAPHRRDARRPAHPGCVDPPLRHPRPVAADVAATILFVMRNQILTVKVIGGGWSIELEAFCLLGALALCVLGGGRYAIPGGRRD